MTTPRNARRAWNANGIRRRSVVSVRRFCHLVAPPTSRRRAEPPHSRRSSATRRGRRRRSPATPPESGGRRSQPASRWASRTTAGARRRHARSPRDRLAVRTEGHEGAQRSRAIQVEDEHAVVCHQVIRSGRTRRHNGTRRLHRVDRHTVYLPSTETTDSAGFGRRSLIAR
jgi:hypothetical protein